MPINTGEAKIQNSNYKIIHDININIFIDIQALLEFELKKYIKVNDYLYIPLWNELKYTKNLLRGLIPKHKRSLDFLGTAWKWLAGSPDHEDLITITDKTNKVLKNNNKQTIINTIYENKINNITDTLNRIINDKIKNETYLHITSLLQYQIQSLKTEIINIKYAIHWAKKNIINTLILNQKELDDIENIFNKENLPYQNSDDAIDYAEVKVLSNYPTLLYIINIPLTSIPVYTKYLIKPVKINGKIVVTPREILAYNNFKDIYEIRNNCNTLNNITICKEEDVIKNANTSCIFSILNSLKGNCTQVVDKSIPEIERVTDNVILLNNFQGHFETIEKQYELNGTYIVNLANETIIIRNLTYESKAKKYHYILPTNLQLKPILNLIHVSELQEIKNLHIDNIENISLLQTHRNAMYTINSIVIIILIILITFLYITNKKTKFIVKNEIPKPEIIDMSFLNKMLPEEH